jgi:hypothetical protein
MPLTDTAIRNAKPGEKPVKLFDERGLYLEISPTGGKWWRFKYRFDGKEKRLSLGVYPDVSLKDARDRRDAARRLLADGIDPSENRKAQKSARADRATNHGERIIRRFERDIFPWIGGRPRCRNHRTRIAHRRAPNREPGSSGPNGYHRRHPARRLARSLQAA